MVIRPVLSTGHVYLTHVVNESHKELDNVVE